MQHMELSFPGYALAQHKGYSTELHKTCIGQRGLSIIHRTSFTQWIDNPDYDEQLSIFDSFTEKETIV